MFRVSYEDHGLVFCQGNGKPLHAHNVVRRDFRRVVVLAKLPRVRFHDLRHMHASYLFTAVVHPKVAQERPRAPLAGLHDEGLRHLLPGMQEDATHLIEP